MHIELWKLGIDKKAKRTSIKQKRSIQKKRRKYLNKAIEDIEAVRYITRRNTLILYGKWKIDTREYKNQQAKPIINIR